MAVTDDKIEVVFDNANGMGAFYPSIKIESISLYNNTTVLNSKQDPHIQHPDEISVTTAFEADMASAFQSMEVHLDLFALLPIENNTYLSALFDGEITKYLKIGVVQCLSKELHNSISADPYKYLNPKSGLISKDPTESVKKVTKWDSFPFSQKLPNNINSALEKENGTGDTSNIGIQTNLPYQKIKTASGKNHYKIPFKHKVVVPASAGGSQPSFLSYFVFTYFDVEELQTSEISLGDTGYSIDIELTPSLEQKLYLGSPAVDIVIKDGQLDPKTYAFKYSKATPPGATAEQRQQLNNLQGTWYYGPAHQMPNGQWMTGASHGASNAPAYLDKMVIPNIKIKDFRQITELESFNFDFNEFSQYFTNSEAVLSLGANAATKDLLKKKNTNYFSDLYMSRDITGSNRFTFSVNMHEMLLSNSMFGDLLIKLRANNKPKYDSIIKGAQIQSFKILRRKTKTHQVVQSDIERITFSKQDFPEMIVHSSDSTSGVLNQKEYNPVQEQGVEENYKSQIECSISELKLYKSISGIRTFTGVDFGVSKKNAGIYQYELQMKVRDPALDYLQVLNSRFRKILEGSPNSQGWTEYMNDVSKPSYSDPYNDRFTLGAYKLFAQKYGSDFISSKVKAFIDSLYELGPVINKPSGFLSKQAEMEKYFTFLCNITSSNTGSIDGVILFYNLVNNMHQNLSKIIATAKGYVKLKEISSSTDPHIENTPNIVSTSKEKYFDVNHVFKELYNAEIPSGHGMDFLSNTLQQNAGGESFVGNSLKVFSVSKILKRFDLETEKLFSISGDGDLSTEVLMESGGAALNPNDTVLNKKYSFLSPSIINVVNKQPFFSLQRATLNDAESYSEFFIDMYGSKMRQYGFLNLNAGNLRSSGNITATQLDILESEKQKRFDLVRIFADKGCTIERNRYKLEKAGANPIFSWGSGFFEQDLIFGPEKLLFQFKDYILDTNVFISKLLSMILYIDDFRLLNKSSNRVDYNTIDFYYPTKQIGGKSFKKEYLNHAASAGSSALSAAAAAAASAPLKSAPNHIKSLLLSTQSPTSVKNSIVKSKVQINTDPFKDTSGFPYILINYKILNRIEVFKGFKDNNVQDPIFEEMTKSDLFQESLQANMLVLCRQKRYYNSTYGINKMENIELPVLDEYFFLFNENPDLNLNQPDFAQNISQTIPGSLIDFESARDPLADSAKQRSRFFDTSNPNDLIRPEYVESGFLEEPRLDDGLSDPVPFNRIAASVRERSLRSTSGENVERLKNMGLGYLLQGYTTTGKQSNATATKGGTIQTKSMVMKTKKGVANSPQGQLVKDSLKNKGQNVTNTTPTNGTTSGGSSGGSKY